MGDRVQRTASFIDGNNDASIIMCNLAVDAGNHHTMVWPLTIKLGELEFKFLKEGQSKRPIYKSDEIMPSNPNLTNMVVDLRSAVAQQNDIIVKLSKKVNEYESDAKKL